MQLYQQTTPFTCAVCSFLMILKHFRKDIPLTREKEFEIWHQSALLPCRAASLYRLALLAKQYGLPVKIIVGQHEYKFPRYRFKGYKLKEVQLASYASELYYRQAKQGGIPILERDFTFDEVKAFLRAGKVLLLRLNSGTLRGEGDKLAVKYFAVLAFTEGNFIVPDPQGVVRQVPEVLMKTAFHDVHEKSKRDNRMMVVG